MKYSMFKRIILWSEFPDITDWKKAQKLIDFKAEIYTAIKDKKQFLNYKKKIKSKNITINAWPVLTKEEGYWFSGFTSIKSIDKLKQYKGLNIKIDLEPPLPNFNYDNIRVLYWLIKLYFKKAKNKDYLQATINWLANNNTKILANEFPLPKFYLKKLGITIEKKKNITLQLMAYTSPAGQMLAPIIRVYNRMMLRKAVKQNPEMSASVGLIGSGILKTEKYYKDTKDFYKDLKMLQDLGIKNVAIYSIDSILQRENPEEWIKVLKQFI